MTAENSFHSVCGHCFNSYTFFARVIDGEIRLLECTQCKGTMAVQEPDDLPWKQRRQRYHCGGCEQDTIVDDEPEGKNGHWICDQCGTIHEVTGGTPDEQGVLVIAARVVNLDELDSNPKLKAELMFARATLIGRGGN